MHFQKAQFRASCQQSDIGGGGGGGEGGGGGGSGGGGGGGDGECRLDPWPSRVLLSFFCVFTFALGNRRQMAQSVNICISGPSRIEPSP
jgi:hypothetical protein